MARSTRCGTAFPLCLGLNVHGKQSPRILDALFGLEDCCRGRHENGRHQCRAKWGCGLLARGPRRPCQPLATPPSGRRRRPHDGDVHRKLCLQAFRRLDARNSRFPRRGSLFISAGRSMTGSPEKTCRYKVLPPTRLGKRPARSGRSRDRSISTDRRKPVPRQRQWRVSFRGTDPMRTV